VIDTNISLHLYVQHMTAAKFYDFVI
jgi:hypothetical protein